MELTKIIRVWDRLHRKNTGELGFCDLEKAITDVDGVKNDVNSNQPTEPNRASKN